ncbi:hypothetical protein [Candidatus Neptunochlamydia vexilliferae]|uniref:Uncharacterized protein n=1 Tax=Candidatus Neptunichlamydia vexilliferae TaxID=1651774 RepID=A0ABS0B1J4_9BACT|nr:hypothetical protein [Candidatus Neptunochlamydia vexilliferae]MBF5059722.1 hypothetical protein [Candidatus Neptunochlamydia vexilliferae]
MGHLNNQMGKMGKVITANFKPSTVSQLKEALAQEFLSFVLITCSEDDGKFNIEMDVKGDPDLVGCMVDGAKNRLD